MPNDAGEGDAPGGPGQVQQPAGGPGPNVGDDFAWRRRALAAEEKLESMSATLRELEAELVRARHGLTESERARALDAALLAAEALDLETARLVARQSGDPEDPSAAVAELKRRKPFLFRTPSRPSSMSASAGRFSDDADLGVDLAERARRTGDRRALMRYLRTRRGV